MKLVKMIISDGDYFHQVSLGLDKRCGFFINGRFLTCLGFVSSDCKKKVYQDLTMVYSQIALIWYILKILAGDLKLDNSLTTYTEEYISN